MQDKGENCDKVLKVLHFGWGVPVFSGQCSPLSEISCRTVKPWARKSCRTGQNVAGLAKNPKDINFGLLGGWGLTPTYKFPHFIKLAVSVFPEPCFSGGQLTPLF